MDRAHRFLEQVLGIVAAEGFGAHAVHVRLGDDEALHLLDEDVPRDVHSIAKGVCVLAAGIACDAGVFDVDRPVVEYLPGVRPGVGTELVTTRHLLGMTSGVDMPWTDDLMAEWPDVAHEFLSRPSAGRVFQYSNASTYTAMRALAAAVGDVHSWLGPRLWEPLGINGSRWDRCPLGFVLGGGGLRLRVAELARLGRLIRDDGAWEGRSLVGSRWTDALHTGWFHRDAPDGYDRYALAGWGGPGDAWRLHGAHGQLLLFRGDAVVTITAHDHVRADRVAALVVAALRTG